MCYLLIKAFEAATLAHLGQTRKGTDIPFAIHPYRVANLLIEDGAPEYVVAAGYLHDVLEDTDFQLNTYDFPPEVIDLVTSLTKRQDSSKTEAIEKISASKWGLLIKLADRLDNLTDRTSSIIETYYKRDDVKESTKLLLNLAKERGLEHMRVWRGLHDFFFGEYDITR